MTKSVRSYVMVTVVALAVIGVVTAIQLQRAMFRPLPGLPRGRTGTKVIRKPSAVIQPARKTQAQPTNIAPMATVSVSSTAAPNPCENPSG